jgi:hypothetical protein
MMKVLPLVILLYCLPAVGWGACVHTSANIWDATGDIADVRSCVNQASAGDTVRITGNATWSGYDTVNGNGSGYCNGANDRPNLCVTKNIKLIGIGTPAITGGDATYMISYVVNTTADNTNLFQLSGFAFDIGASYGVIDLFNQQTYPPAHKIRIDHNSITNSTASHAYAIVNQGTRGLVDNNTFDSIWIVIENLGEVSTEWVWAAYPNLLWGKSWDDNDQSNFYIEDNIFTNVVDRTVADGGQGARYVMRYNTITPGGTSSPLFDIHPFCMGAEWYGNNVTGGGGLTSIRGGRVTTHHNLASVDTSIDLMSYTGAGCNVGRQIIHAYNFQNRKNADALMGWTSAMDDCNEVVENTTFWMDDVTDSNCQSGGSCANVTVGIGCGTSLPASCTTGTGYWLTTQSCTSLTGMVGKNPATPISGTLYTCKATNTWNTSGDAVPPYTPYTYPHPLRGSSPSPSRNNGGRNNGGRL